MAPMTVEVEQQHITALVNFANSAAQSFALPAAAANSGAQNSSKVTGSRGLGVLPQVMEIQQRNLPCSLQSRHTFGEGTFVSMVA